LLIFYTLNKEKSLICKKMKDFSNYLFINTLILFFLKEPIQCDANYIYLIFETKN